MSQVSYVVECLSCGVCFFEDNSPDLVFGQYQKIHGVCEVCFQPVQISFYLSDTFGNFERYGKVVLDKNVHFSQELF